MKCEDCFYYAACEHFANGDAVECKDKNVDKKCPLFLRMSCETCAFCRDNVAGGKSCVHILHHTTDARECFYCSDWLKKG